MIELNPRNELEPKVGRLLLAEPFLSEPHFKRSVIFLCEHSEEGSLGFVLNKFSDIKLSDIIDMPEAEAFDIAIGGPVEPESLYFLHTLGKEIKDSIEIVDGVYMGGDFDQVKFLIKEKLITPEQIRFFIGYSGWSKDQLSDEMKEDAWYVSESKKDFIMNVSSESLWNEVLENMGTEFKIISNFPESPALN